MPNAAWMVAPCLDTLLAQVNRYAPKRSKLSDGSIGDQAHAARDSEHNPKKLPFSATPLVRARDFTHDPAGGFNAGFLAGALVKLRSPLVRYVIWNKQIWQANTGWKPYDGANDHTKHCHVSVTDSPEIMQTSLWMIPEFSGVPVVIPVPSFPPMGRRNLARGDSGADVWAVAEFFNRNFPAYSGTPIPKVAPPQPFGPQTEQVVKEFQRRMNMAPDGIVGPQTYAAMAKFGFK